MSKGTLKLFRKIYEKQKKSQDEITDEEYPQRVLHNYKALMPRVCKISLPKSIPIHKYLKGISLKS